ncbi:MAG TPA: hypothetical protein VEH27_19990 [Methylomirabilota bacterium]|nr:hypothetical protein [Methylomirabilota bacterium]
MVKVWQIALATLLIYTAGVFTGGLLLKVTTSPQAAAPADVLKPRPLDERGEPKRREGEWRERRKSFIDYFAKELDLNPEQRTKVEAIITAGQDRIRSRVDPITKEELERTHQELLKELNPEQQAKAEAFRERMRNNPPGGPQGPGHRDDRHFKEKKIESDKIKGAGRPEACSPVSGGDSFAARS